MFKNFYEKMFHVFKVSLIANFEYIFHLGTAQCSAKFIVLPFWNILKFIYFMEYFKHL